MRARRGRSFSSIKSGTPGQQEKMNMESVWPLPTRLPTGSGHWQVLQADPGLYGHYHEIAHQLSKYGAMPLNAAYERLDKSGLFAEPRIALEVELFVREPPREYALRMLGFRTPDSDVFLPAETKDEWSPLSAEFGLYHDLYMKWQQNHTEDGARNWYTAAVRRIDEIKTLTKYFHGTAVVAARSALEGIAPLSVNRDFSSVANPGFYVTLDSCQSVAAALAREDNKGSEGDDGPAIVEFILPREELARLRTKTFGPNDFAEWWQFVKACRRGEAHGYEAVEGPYLSDPQVLRDPAWRMDTADSISRRRDMAKMIQAPLAHGHQLCLCSRRAWELFDSAKRRVFKGSALKELLGQTP